MIPAIALGRHGACGKPRASGDDPSLRERVLIEEG